MLWRHLGAQRQLSSGVGHVQRLIKDKGVPRVEATVAEQYVRRVSTLGTEEISSLKQPDAQTMDAAGAGKGPTNTASGVDIPAFCKHYKYITAVVPLHKCTATAAVMSVPKMTKVLHRPPRQVV